MRSPHWRPTRLCERSGRGYGSWQLAVEYDLYDVDGARPDSGAHAAKNGFGVDQACGDLRLRAMYDAPEPKHRA